MKEISVTVPGGRGGYLEFRIAPGARPRDLLEAIGVTGAIAAASRPAAPFGLDDDLHTLIETGEQLTVASP